MQSWTVEGTLQEAFFYACIFTVPDLISFLGKIKLTWHRYASVSFQK